MLQRNHPMFYQQCGAVCTCVLPQIPLERVGVLRGAAAPPGDVAHRSLGAAAGGVSDGDSCGRLAGQAAASAAIIHSHS